MNTSRAALDRLLDPENPSVTLHTLHSAAKAVGGRLRVIAWRCRSDSLTPLRLRLQMFSK